MPPSRVAIIGVGLIGGSLARALKRAGERVTGYDTDPMALRRASEIGVIDEPCADLSRAVEGAEIVVIAVPLGAVAEIFQGLAGHLDGHAVITDVGSVKGSVVHAARRYLEHHLPRFVPGHPIAGTEHGGVESSCAGLFHGQRVILTPLAETDPRALERVRLLWRQTGAVVEDMEVDRHDQVFAAISHLPHVLAYALVRAAARVSGRSALVRYAAGGFADITRIASSNPVMWRDIFFANRARLIDMIERFREDLAMLRDAIEAEDGPAVVAFLDEAKNTRDALAAEQRIGPDLAGEKKR
ncbi:MAG: prephenate dehydrogenase/arogenate dehydrogenase family protein [Pseudomonadota bacterium]|nr:prephenate dehydrogenase/arogenate dehydrogenase family protein [Pseudomonadota bacterium]